MGKDDIYFAIATVLGVVALFGMDWKLVKGTVPVLSGRHWVLFFLILGSLGCSTTGWYRSRHQNLLKWSMRRDQEELDYGKHFRNELVVLDGKRFDHCSFENVTFVYHALAPSEFVVSTFVKTGTFLSKNR